MKKITYLFIVLMFAAMISKAQTPLQISGNDCDGNPHDLYAELDAGKAVVVFFFMDNCGACPPPAQKVQTMMNNITVDYPGMITGYAMPFNNSTTCAATSSWCAAYGHQFAPYDSGAFQVAYYGGFGMPTVVLLGGTGANKRVMFSTLSFLTSDTTIMRDSILALFNSSSGTADLPSSVSAFSIYPNPATENVSVNVNLKEPSVIFIDVADISGKQVAIIMNEQQSGLLTKQFNVSELPRGNYLIRLRVSGKTVAQKLSVNH
jgi:Secretion system C-terminal sorting domain